jgi:hypothetical protein
LQPTRQAASGQACARAKQIGEINAERDELAGKIRTVLDNAAFHNKAVDEDAEDELGHRAKR